MIFSDSPSQKAIERMMTQVKGFPPRGSGVMVLRRFEYTAEMCDCRLCLYYNRKKKCTVSQCPCIEERIVAGAAGRSEVMTETTRHSLPRSTIESAPCALNGKRNSPRTKVTSSLINSRNCRASSMNMSRQKPSTRICSIRSLKRQS